MITVYIDTALGVMVSEDTDDDLDDEFTKYVVEAVAIAADKAYRKAMGIGEVQH
jgi:hypothetical protein